MEHGFQELGRVIPRVPFIQRPTPIYKSIAPAGTTSPFAERGTALSHLESVPFQASGASHLADVACIDGWEWEGEWQRAHKIDEGCASEWQAAPDFAQLRQASITETR